MVRRKEYRDFPRLGHNYSPKPGEQSCETDFRQAQPNNCGMELVVAIPQTVLCLKPRESR